MSKKDEFSTNIPAAEDAEVWKLVALKKGHKTELSSRVRNLKAKLKPIKHKSALENDKETRRTLFNSTKYRMHLWKNPVHKHRLADQLIFPLNNNAIEQYGSETAKARKQEQTSATLSKTAPKACRDLYNCIFKSQPQRSSEELTKQLTLEQHRNLAITLSKKADLTHRDRLRKEYIAQKLSRQKKIKSKNFHRHLKKREMKEYEKQTELLRTTDPEAFSQRLLEAEKQRAHERISQKHKGGSKFARMQKLRARYDGEARNAVSAMHDLHQDLTKKTGAESDSEDSDIDLSSTDSESDSSNEESDDFDDEEDAQESQRLKSAMWWRQIEEKPKEEEKKRKTGSHIISTLNVEKNLTEAMEDECPVVGGTLSEKMAELCSGEMDDLVELDFAKEKAGVAEEEAPKDLDTYLPGWNTWTGPGTEQEDEERRRKRVVKAPKRARKDAKQSKAIVRERVNGEMKKHLVKTIPFPYNNPEQFEATLKQPIGREWNTEMSHRDLIRPRVVVQKGKIIRPLDQSAAFIREKDLDRLSKNKKLPL